MSASSLSGKTSFSPTQADADAIIEKLRLGEPPRRGVRYYSVGHDQFLKSVADDPGLLERLAQRQMKMVREGTSVLEVKGESTDGRDMSPYVLTTLAPPVLPPPYQPRGGILAALVSNPRSQLYVMGGGMLLVAAGLVMGSAPATKRET